MMHDWAPLLPILDSVYVAADGTPPFLNLTYPKTIWHWQSIGLTDLIAPVVPLVFYLVPLFCLHLLAPRVRYDEIFAWLWGVSC